MNRSNRPWPDWQITEEEFNRIKISIERSLHANYLISPDRCREIAHDACTETMEAMVRYPGKVRSFEALARSRANALINSETHRLRPLRSLDANMPEVFEIQDSSEPIDSDLLTDEGTEVLMDAMRPLLAIERSVVLLKLYGLNTKQIAAVQEESVEEINRHWRNARGKMRRNRDAAEYFARS